MGLSSPRRNEKRKGQAPTGRDGYSREQAKHVIKNEARGTNGHNVEPDRQPCGGARLNSEVMGIGTVGRRQRPLTPAQIEAFAPQARTVGSAPRSYAWMLEELRRANNSNSAFQREQMIRTMLFNAAGSGRHSVASKPIMCSRQSCKINQIPTKCHMCSSRKTL